MFSRIWDEETTDERLFSVNETILSGIDCEDRDFSEKEEQKSKIRTAGKVAALTGAGAALAGGIAEHVIADKVAGKVADRVGTLRAGRGVASKFMSPKAAEMTGRVLKQNKAFRTAVKADKIGTGLALAGTAAYLYGRHKDKKNSMKD